MSLSRHPRTRALALVAWVLGACTSTERPAAEGQGTTSPGAATAPAASPPVASAARAPGAEPSPSSSAAVPPASTAPNVAPPTDLAFADFVASHCYIDQLGPSAYVWAWLRYEVRPEVLDPGAILPAPEGARPPSPGSPEAQALAAKLRREWLAEPRSHVVDCRFTVLPRMCPLCAQRPGTFTANYVAYLPAALFTAPERVRALLLVVPGGRGGRSRPFLSPIPDKTIFHQGSGGLQTKQRVDAYLAVHPGAVPPIVVGLESRGAEVNNGQVEHITHDLPAHIAETFLGAVPLPELVIGAEGISSGGRAVVEASVEKPDAFEALALTCMACGKLDPRRAFGFPTTQADAWARRLAERAQAGDFEMRFTMGSRDGQKPCSEALYAFLGERALFDAGRPAVYANCVAGKPESEEVCDTDRPGWVSFVGEMHHYGLLKKSYPPELDWLLGVLDRVHRRRAGALPAP